MLYVIQQGSSRWCCYGVVAYAHLCSIALVAGSYYLGCWLLLLLQLLPFILSPAALITPQEERSWGLGTLKTKHSQHVCLGNWSTVCRFGMVSHLQNGSWVSH